MSQIKGKLSNMAPKKANAKAAKSSGTKKPKSSKKSSRSPFMDKLIKLGLKLLISFIIFIIFGSTCSITAVVFRKEIRNAFNASLNKVKSAFNAKITEQIKKNDNKDKKDEVDILEKSNSNDDDNDKEPEISISNNVPNSIKNDEVITVSSKYDNLSLGVPGKADTIIDRIGYSLGYIEYHEQPAWVIYRLTDKEATTKAAKRGNDFREDKEIPTGSATLADYRRTKYDRGHLAPAADMAFSNKTMSESFYMSNMSPQTGPFNRGIWKNLEEQVRQFAIVEKDIYVVTGPILPKTKTITIGANKVTVPEYYYKVVYDLTPPQKMIGFILPNKGSNKALQDFAVTVDAVEEKTGLNFFSTLPKDRQDYLEQNLDVQKWKWMKKKR
jgi:endonuclease G